MVFDPFTLLSALVVGVKAASLIVEKLKGKKKKEDKIRRAEAGLYEKMRDVLAALEANQKLAVFHVGSFAKGDRTPPKLEVVNVRYFIQTTAKYTIRGRPITSPPVEKDRGRGDICPETSRVLEPPSSCVETQKGDNRYAHSSISAKGSSGINTTSIDHHQR